MSSVPTLRPSLHLWIAICAGALLLLFPTLPDTASAAALPATIEEDMTLTEAESPYTGSFVTVEEGVTLKAEPGAIVKITGRLKVNGTLNVEGTAENPVTFSSIKDDSAGGDTNEDGEATSPAPGDWWGILFESTSAGTIDHAVIRYGGHNGDYSAVTFKCACETSAIKNSTVRYSENRGVYVYQGDADVINNTISDNEEAGIEIFGGGPEITENKIANNRVGVNYAQSVSYATTIDLTDNEIEDNDEEGIRVFAGSSLSVIESASIGNNTVEGNGGKAIKYDVFGTTDPEIASNPIPPEITSNTVSGNGENGIWLRGEVQESTTWEDAGYPIVFVSKAAIDHEATLTLEAGLVIKNPVLDIAGTLNAEGTAEDPVTLTSLKDDSVGGDTNNDGEATSPAAGDWGEILFEGSSSGALDHAVIRYGGWNSNGNYSMLTFKCPCETQSTIKNSTLSYSKYKGIYVYRGSPKIVNDNIAGSGEAGIYVLGGAPEIAENTISEGGNNGITFTVNSTYPGTVNFTENEIDGNAADGISVSAPTAYTIIESASIDGNTISGNGGKAIRYDAYATTSTNPKYHSNAIPPEITSNTVSGNGENGIWLRGEVQESTTWEDAGYPVVVLNELPIVGEGVTLTLEPDLVIKNGGLKVAGTLTAKGTEEEPITFTSLKDDSVGGDTNGDGGASEPTAGDWARNQFEPASTNSVLEYVHIKYAEKGIEIKCPCETGPTIKRSVFYANEYGVYVAGDPGETWNGDPIVSRSAFFLNTSYATYKSGTGLIWTPYNEYGCFSGPLPSGCGDRVNNKVVAWPLAAQADEKGNCRGKKTQCPMGADPVSLPTGELAYSHRDLLLTNGSGHPLEFVRSYSSGDDSDTGLGRGWSQTGLVIAIELESEDVLVRREDGRQDVFEKTESGYTPPSGVTDTLVENEDETFTLTTLDQTVYDFDETGRIATITDDHGLETVYAYDGNERLSTITDPAEQTLSFSYDASNHITKVTDSTEREVKFTYSETGELETVTDALGGVTKYSYDSAGRLETIADPKENVILENTYDEQGRIVEQVDGSGNLWALEYKDDETIVTEPEGGELKYEFDELGRTTSATDQLGNKTSTGYDESGNVDEMVKPGSAKWQFGYDSAGNLTSVTDPKEGERSYEYDGQNRLTSFTDEREKTWTYEWSEDNDLEKIVDPLEGEAVLTHNEAGLPLTVTDPNGHTTTFTYDGRGNRATVEDPLEHTTEYEYDSRSFLTAVGRPGLEATVYGRNALGDLVSETTPEGSKTEYAYDKNGALTQITDPAEGVWKVERNAMERPVAFVDPQENSTEVEYDKNLNPVKVTDRRGKATSFEYDSANRLTGVEAPEEGDWKFGYDGRGNRTSVVDPREGETTYEYDLLDRMTKVTEPLEAMTSYGYDGTGNLTSYSDARENTTGLVYDGLGRLTEINQPLEKTTGFTYDGVGNRLTRTTAAGTLEYEYDAADRLQTIGAGEVALRSFGYDAADRLTTAVDAQSAEIVIGYNEDSEVVSLEDGRGQTASREYDSRGNLIGQTDGRGSLAYGYDALNRMTSLTDPQEGELGFSYDAEGNLTKTELPNEVTTTNTYDDSGRLETTTAVGPEEAVLESLEYGYDAAGNRTSVVDRLSQETTYAYDARNRLTEFNPPGEGSTAYGYDAAGNRTEAGEVGYEFDALNRLTEASDGSGYEYDGAGRLVEVVNGEEATSFSWNLFDELVGVEAGEEEISYTYDSFGRRALRDDGSVEREAHYGDLSDRPMVDTDAEGEVVAGYVSGPAGLVEQRAGGATSFPLADAHGDVTALADEAGEVASRQTYDPWGAQLSGPALELGYLGAQQRRSDAATGLVQMGVRPYDPALGGFLAEDPVLSMIGVGAAANRYAYVWDNPLALFDLDGRFPGPGEIVGKVGSWIDAGWDATAGARDTLGIAGNGNGGVVGDALEGGAGLVSDAWNTARDGLSYFVKTLRSECGKSFGDRALDAFTTTNSSVPGLVAPTLSGGVVNRFGGVAKKLGTMTPFDWVKNSRNISKLPAVARAAGLSWLLAGAAWETGAGIGSLIRSGLVEAVC